MSKTWTLKTLAEALNATLQGNEETPVIGLADIEAAEPGDLVFAENEKFLGLALKSRASVILTSSALATTLTEPTEKALLLTENPRATFVEALEIFVPVAMFKPGTVHPSAFVGKNVRLGERVTIYPGVFVGDNCSVGDDTILFANVVLYSEVIVGQRCIFHSGAVIGADGFGFIPVGRGIRKVPHLGTVEIGDDVEIGANSCVDRAKTGVTKIGSGTKMDNLVHIAHNCKIGQMCLMAAQTGIAGSVIAGDGVFFAGQSGVIDHLTIGDGARLAAKTVVIGDVAAGETMIGFPARPHRAKMREYAMVARLPKTLQKITELEKRLKTLEAALEVKNEVKNSEGVSEE